MILFIITILHENSATKADYYCKLIFALIFMLHHNRCTLMKPSLRVVEKDKCTKSTIIQFNLFSQIKIRGNGGKFRLLFALVVLIKLFESKLFRYHGKWLFITKKMLIVFVSLILFKVMIKVNIMILKNIKNCVYPNLTSFFFVLSLSPRFSNI